MGQPSEASRFYLIGNNLGIDFINTRSRQHGEVKELLETFEDFVSWGATAGMMQLREAENLIQIWGDKGKGRQILRLALEFRETLREMAEGAAGRETVSPAVIAAINSILKEGNGYAEVVRTKEGLEKRFHVDYSDPQQLLVPIAEAAADLLCYGDLARVKKCEGADCLLYFYDATKNHSRRWCSMAACGNRAKAAAFYQRHSRNLPLK